MEIIPEHKFMLDEIVDIKMQIGRAKIENPNAFMQCLLGFVDRLYLALGNAHLLISIRPYHSEIIYGLSLCLRTVMVDAFLATELLHTAQACSADMDFSPLIEQGVSILADGFTYSKGYLERLKNAVPEFELEQTLEKLFDEIKHLHAVNSMSFDKPKNIQISQMLKNSGKYADYHRHFDIYYTVFSKVEHLSLTYFNWLNFPLERKEESIYKALKTCMLHYWNILSLLLVSNFDYAFVVSKIEAFNSFSATVAPEHSPN